ncbi:unnamed protein product [Somion occarium]|uniref:Uncharacterized protein n=1 Tax=Somion occarium TaxID=3059160 RepID=A0ABP1DJF1_9APHY
MITVEELPPFTSFIYKDEPRYLKLEVLGPDELNQVLDYIEKNKNKGAKYLKEVREAVFVLSQEHLEADSDQTSSMTSVSYCELIIRFLRDYACVSWDVTLSGLQVFPLKYLQKLDARCVPVCKLALIDCKFEKFDELLALLSIFQPFWKFGLVRTTWSNAVNESQIQLKSKEFRPHFYYLRKLTIYVTNALEVALWKPIMEYPWLRITDLAITWNKEYDLIPTFHLMRLPLCRILRIKIVSRPVPPTGYPLSDSAPRASGTLRWMAQLFPSSSAPGPDDAYPRYPAKSPNFGVNDTTYKDWLNYVEIDYSEMDVSLFTSPVWRDLDIRLKGLVCKNRYNGIKRVVFKSPACLKGQPERACGLFFNCIPSLGDEACGMIDILEADDSTEQLPYTYFKFT